MAGTMFQVDGGSTVVVEARIDDDGEGASAGGGSNKKLAKALRGVGFITMAMAIGIFVYKPPHGLLFESHVSAYYVTLAGIFVAGVAEVWTAFWVSGAHDDDDGRCKFGRAVLWASVVPLAAAVSFGGYAILFKG